jgi:hypothetical protein
MSDEKDPNLSWDFKLDFDSFDAPKEPAPKTTKIPPRQVLADHFPHILERIELLWGSIELFDYLEHTLTTDRSTRQGFPQNVVLALGEIHVEHTKLLKAKGMIKEDVWDKQFRK